MPSERYLSALREHGANPEKLYEALGIAVPRCGIIDFSTNTSVLAWPATDIPAASELASAYPDDECRELRGIIAEREDISPDCVLFTNGSNEALYLAASLLTGKRAAVLQPSYGEYARALRAYGADVRNVFSHDELCGFDAAVICNPRNPTGAYIRGLGDLAAANPGTLFIIDEAYIDFLLDGEPERIDAAGAENIIILRSLTKIFHLSGARIGYVIANADIIRRLKARQPTWSVNAFAQALAKRFLADEDLPGRTREFYRAETPRFIAAIEAAGFTVRPTSTHFFLMETDDDEGTLLRLMRSGITARHTRNFPGLDGSCLRVATRTPQDNERFVRAI